ncbi:MAG: ABC-F family ATP-binding cassette domain-containing protein [Planctomycetales bacterium]|nr:ABC-F family ATP-binding cassette domain-containing protein [Planctomycetales bacterium]
MSLLLQVESVRKYYGSEPVLDGVDFELRDGDRAAIVGPNGAGKTTLIRIITGEEEADAGRVVLRPDARLGVLEQHADFAPEDTVWSVAASALASLTRLVDEAHEAAEALAACRDEAERQRLGERYDHLQHELHRRDAYQLDHKVQRVLDGMGFPPDSHAQPAAQLSGGQQSRLLLAKLLLSDPDLLVLDEPSNHLDIQATEWLEGFLIECRSAVLIVSHDRYFLDRVSKRTLELCHGTIDVYAGNYSAYTRQKSERLVVQQRTYEKQQIEIAKMEDFVRRNHHGQKHAQAEDRRRKLERIERVELPREIAAPPMGFPPAERTGDIVVRVEGLSKGFDRPLFQDLTFDILRGEKWGILGPNGTGKTTLLRCLVGELAADTGSVAFGAGVKVGYFDQLLRCVEDDVQAVDAIRPDHKEFVEQQRRDLLAKFGIVGDMVFQPVKSLSGGERNRTALAMLAASDANLLVLDEPTNHLDLWSRSALEASINKFQGTVLFVSHDRYFLNEVADHLLVVEPNRFRVIEGNYDAFRHLVRQGMAAEAESSRQASASTVPAESRSKGKPKDKPKPKRKFPFRKPADIEVDIEACELRIDEIHRLLAEPDTHRDGDRVKQLTQELQEQQAALEQLFEHWEEASS